MRGKKMDARKWSYEKEGRPTITITHEAQSHYKSEWSVQLQGQDNKVYSLDTFDGALEMARGLRSKNDLVILEELTGDKERWTDITNIF